MIIEAIAISDYTLAVCYCSDWFYRLSIVAPDGRVFDFDDIYKKGWEYPYLLR